MRKLQKKIIDQSYIFYELCEGKKEVKLTLSGVDVSISVKWFFLI